MDADRFFVKLAAETDEEPTTTETAPPRLMSRVYSALVAEQEAAAPLRSLSATAADGGKLCVFERLVAAAPVGEAVKSMNPCNVCHARFLAERLPRAPIFWPNCPYAELQKP